MRIAFLGLGRMGTGMARNLLRAGHTVTVFNRTREKAQALAGDGANVAESIEHACRDAEVCWTMLADDNAVRDTVFSAGGVADSLSEGATHISSSTITVAMGRTLASEHGRRKQGYLSVPVFGRPEAAETKKLIAVAGGPQLLIDRLSVAIDGVSRATYVAGAEPWQANLLKLCGNFTLLSMVETLGEAFAAFRKAGGDHRILFEVITDLYASPVYKNYGTIIIDEKFEPPGMTLKLILKDLRQMLEAADGLDVPMPLASVIRDQLLTAMANGQGAMDAASLASVAARNAGVISA